MYDEFAVVVLDVDGVFFLDDDADSLALGS